MVEEARLESVYTPKAYRGFESPSLRQNTALTFIKVGAFFLFLSAVSRFSWLVPWVE